MRRLKDFAIWLVEHLLRGDLTVVQRNKLVVHIMKSVQAWPLHAIIVDSGEGLLINGQPLDIEKARVLRDSALRVLENQAFNLCHDQVRFLAVKEGLATGLPPEGLLFYRAAMWNMENMKSVLARLAQTDQQLSALTGD